MALTFDLLLTVEDAKGKSSDTTVNLPTTFGLGAYGEFAVALINILDAVTSGLVTAALLCLSVDLSGLTDNGTVFSDVDVEEKAHFKFRTVNNRSVDVKIPCINEAVMGAGTDDVNESLTDVQAFIDGILVGVTVTGGAINACDIDEEDLTTLVFARESYVPRSRRS